MTHDNASPDAAKAAEPQDGKGEFAFQIFCASIFLGMIGLVFYNAFLRYVFRSAFAPSEEWARFLFMFITFYGAIEAFYRKKHIAVDLFVGLFAGMTRKALDVTAQVLGLAALTLLLWGGVELVGQMLDTKSVATGINMGVISAALPIMAFAAIVIRGKELFEMVRKPASEFRRNDFDPLKEMEKE